MVLSENVNTLEPLNSRYHWSLAQNPHKIKPVNDPGEREKELLRPHSWLSSYWQLMALGKPVFFRGVATGKLPVLQ